MHTLDEEILELCTRWWAQRAETEAIEKRGKGLRYGSPANKAQEKELADAMGSEDALEERLAYHRPASPEATRAMIEVAAAIYRRQMSRGHGDRHHEGEILLAVAHGAQHLGAIDPSPDLVALTTRALQLQSKHDAMADPETPEGLKLLDEFNDACEAYRSFQPRNVADVVLFARTEEKTENGLDYHKDVLARVLSEIERLMGEPEAAPEAIAAE